MAAAPIASVLKKWFHVDVIKMFASSIMELSRQGSEGSFPVIDDISSYRFAGVKKTKLTIDGSLHREELTRHIVFRRNEQIQKGIFAEMRGYASSLLWSLSSHQALC